MRDWKNLRVLIIGAARQGLALARYLNGKGAKVTLNDRRSAEELRVEREAMAGLDIRWVLGGHPLEILDTTDLVCLSGGIALSMPLVAQALERGIPITNDSQIFLEVVPGTVIGITGSSGKSTTTTLVGRMAEAHAAEKSSSEGTVKAWVGGNLGVPLISSVDEMQPADISVVELSSFQLEIMDRSPQIAAILNITPNHLDRHGTMEVYTAIKARIFQFQQKDGVTVLNREESGAWSLRSQVPGKVISFGLDEPSGEFTGTFLRDGVFYMRLNGETTPLCPENLVRLRGRHNTQNVLAACAVAVAAGFSPAAIQKGIAEFTGIPHRLEFVRSWRGADWYNDSIATTPERAIAAIKSFDEPLVLLAGGRDKKLPWEEFAELAHKRVDHLVVFGEAAEIIVNSMGETQPGKRPYTLARCKGLQEAVAAASQVVEAGDVVLLAPGGTSFDEFKDFEMRGERFRKWVRELS